MPSRHAPNIKQRLRDGGIVYAAWLTFGSAAVAELIAGAGFDVLLIDLEHTSISLETLESVLAAVARWDPVTIVRVPDHAPGRIKRILDIGADGIMAPMVMDALQAKAVVDAVKYAPLGRRGYGPRRASDYFRNPGYAAEANDRTFVMMQIEHPEAARQADQIAAVPGLDVLCLGPADMAMSCGHFDEPGHTEVQDSIARVFAAAAGRGLPVCMGRYEPADTQADLVARGARFVIASDDLVVLRSGLSADLAAARRAIGEDNGPDRRKEAY